MSAPTSGATKKIQTWASESGPPKTAVARERAGLSLDVWGSKEDRAAQNYVLRQMERARIVVAIGSSPQWASNADNGSSAVDIALAIMLGDECVNFYDGALICEGVISKDSGAMTWGSVVLTNLSFSAYKASGFHHHEMRH